MRCEVLLTVKWNGVRHEPGSFLDLPDEQVALLPDGTVRAVAPPPPPPPPKEKRSKADKTQAVTTAQARVTAATGGVLPDPTPAE